MSKTTLIRILRSRRLPVILLILLIACYTIIFSAIAYLKYESFSFQDMDLAVINQTFWNATQGRFISNFHGQAALLSGHKWFIAIPLLPIHAIFPGSFTLLFLQTIGLSLGAWAIFLLGREMISPLAGLLFSFCYLIYPALNYVNLFEFHPIAFATPLLLFTFYYYQRRRWGLYLLFLFLSLSCREDIFIPVLGIGLFALLEGIRDKDGKLFSRMKWGLVAILSSLIWLVICLKVIPMLIESGQPPSNNPTMVESFYGWLGNSPGEILGNIFFHPGKILRGILIQPKLLYLFHLLIPLGFVSLFSPSALIMVLVSLAEGLLSSRFSHFSIRYQYSSIITPFIFISAIYGVRNILRWKWPRGKAKIILPVILIFSIVSAKYLGPLFNLPEGIQLWRVTQEDRVRQTLVDEVPPAASVATTFEFGPKLSMRPQLFLFYHLYASSRKLGFAQHIPIMQEMAEYVLIDFNDWLTFYDFYTPGGYKSIFNYLTEGKWRLVTTVNSLALYKKSDHSDLGVVSNVTGSEYPRLKNIPNIPELKFAGVKLNKNKVLNEPVISLEVNLKCDESLRDNMLLAARFTSHTDRSKGFQQFYFAPYRIYPTSLWRPGDIVRQKCNLMVPEDIPGGEYDLILSLIRKRPNLPLSPEARKMFYNYYDTAMAMEYLPGRWSISPDKLLEQIFIASIPKAVIIEK